MLTTDPAVRGRGVGRDLVRFAEDTCRNRGSTKMQLKLLRPRHWVLDSKEALHAWYSRRWSRRTTDASTVRPGFLRDLTPDTGPIGCYREKWR